MTEMSSGDACSQMVRRSHGLLARLPLLFTASGDSDQARALALRHLKNELHAEAATLFLLDPTHKHLRLWAVEGGESSLTTAVIPAERGIVGWVVERQESAMVSDAALDPRFFQEVDQASGFRTRSVLCVPLSGAGRERIGAIQVLNREGGDFTHEDLELVECLAPQFVLGLQNALLRERIVEQQETLEALKRKRNDMLTVLSHELRTPLGLVQTASDLLSRGKLDAEMQSRTLQRLNEGLQRLTRLASQIRNAAALRGAKIEVPKAPMSVSAVCEAVIGQLSAAAAAVRKLEIAKDLPPDLVSVGDDALFGMALSNLVHNAIRFTPDGGSIRIEARRELGVIVLNIIDSGIGIPEDQRGAIFEKFYEVGDTMAHSSGSLGFRSGGLGLGLATAKAILDAHGASLEVESEVGAGTTFRVRIQGV